MSPRRANPRSRPLIETVRPPAAIIGGELEILGSGFSDNGGQRARVRLGSVDARIVVGSSRRAVVRVPEEATEGKLVLETGSRKSDPYFCSIGVTIAENLHPVSNPAVDTHGNGPARGRMSRQFSHAITPAARPSGPTP